MGLFTEDTEVRLSLENRDFRFFHMEVEFLIGYPRRNVQKATQLNVLSKRGRLGN